MSPENFSRIQKDWVKPEPFTRAYSKIKAVEIKRRRMKLMITIPTPKHSIKEKHPDWCKDAHLETPKYSLMMKKIKEKCEDKQLLNETFERKLHTVDGAQIG